MLNAAQIIFVMFLWAICFPLIVFGLSYAPHLTFAALRAFLAGATLIVIAVCLKRPQPRDIGTWIMLFAIGLGATTLGFFGMFHASEFVSPGLATVIANTQPLMAAVLASMFLKEHLNGFGKIGLFLGFLGIVLIALPSVMSNTNDEFLLGILYIGMAAVGITVSNVLIRHIAHRVDALSAMGWQLVLGSCFLAIIALYTEEIHISWNLSFILSLLGLALPGTALAYWLWCRVLRQVELNSANAFSFLVPIFGVAIGVAFFQENFGVLTGIGIGLTILGIFLVNWPAKQNATESLAEGK